MNLEPAGAISCDAFETRIRSTICDHRLLYRRRIVIMGVSGGADSMSMLHAMAAMQSSKIKMLVAHVHHGLRGRAADLDAKLVEAAARQLGLQFRLKRVDVRKLARRQQISIEMAAREARHEFFRELTGKHGGIVATAHTRDDQAETMLMRLLRGSSADGLGGMDYETNFRDLTIVRPLLDISHAEAMGYLRAKKVKWREDASNSDPSMLRNRIRNELLPLLEKRYNPRIREVLVRTGAIIRTDSEALTRLAEVEFKQRLISKSTLSATSPPTDAIWHRVIYSWLLHRIRILPARIDSDLIHRIEQLARDGGKMTLPGNVTLVANKSLLSFPRAYPKTS